MFGFRECDSEIVYRIKAAAADAESQAIHGVDVAIPRVRGGNGGRGMQDPP